MLPKFSNPLIELCDYVDTASTWGEGGVYTESQRQQRRRRRRRRQHRAQDHSCIRVKPRLCGAARRQATGDYNGISSRLAYELRSPSSGLPPGAIFHVSRSNAVMRASLGSSFPFLCMCLSSPLSIFLHLSLQHPSLSFSLRRSCPFIHVRIAVLLHLDCAPYVSLPAVVETEDYPEDLGVVASSPEHCPRCGADFANGNEEGPNGS